MRLPDAPSSPASKTLDILAFPASEPTAPRLWTRRYPAHAHHEEPPHLHRFFELVFIEEGEGTQAIDGRRFAASPGDAFWIAPGQLHDSTGLYGTTKWLIACIVTRRSALLLVWVKRCTRGCNSLPREWCRCWRRSPGRWGPAWARPSAW
ncbi:AraC family ligand binding domain-containing protein [Archangium sp.]|uniref:AraC family ligand binding domain-containing protein n=1 Tax=Archangium sp. TaxID=1872627 RepID=UPI0039C8B100